MTTAILFLIAFVLIVIAAGVYEISKTLSLIRTLIEGAIANHK